MLLMEEYFTIFPMYDTLVNGNCTMVSTLDFIIYFAKSAVPFIYWVVKIFVIHVRACFCFINFG